MKLFICTLVYQGGGTTLNVNIQVIQISAGEKFTLTGKGPAGSGVSLYQITNYPPGGYPVNPKPTYVKIKDYTVPFVDNYPTAAADTYYFVTSPINGATPNNSSQPAANSIQLFYADGAEVDFTN